MRPWSAGHVFNRASVTVRTVQAWLCTYWGALGIDRAGKWRCRAIGETFSRR